MTNQSKEPITEREWQLLSVVRKYLLLKDGDYGAMSLRELKCVLRRYNGVERVGYEKLQLVTPDKEYTDDELQARYECMQLVMGKRSRIDSL